MNPRYARNILPPAHSGFTEEFEAIDAEWAAMDGAGFEPLGRINQFAIAWAAQDERNCALMARSRQSVCGIWRNCALASRS